MSGLSAPKVLSLPRITTLVSAIIVALAAGTNYVYSAYAPQLAARLRISHTKLNVIGLAGNIGVYSTGPFWGRIVDRRGPRILLACGFVFLLVGYSGIRYFYNSPDTAQGDAEKLSHFAFAALTICAFLTGAGGNGGLTASVNATAKSFPDEMRASATGFVISGFGLSAFFFSALARILYPDDTSSFLLTLALGTSFPMILGFFLVRPIPLPTSSSVSVFEPQDDVQPSVSVTHNRRLSSSSIPRDGFAHSVGVDTVFGNDSIVFEHQHPNDSQTTLLATHHHRGHQHLHHLHSPSETDLLRHDSQHDRHSPEMGTGVNRRRHSIEFVAALSPPPHGRRHRSLSAVSHSRTRSRVIEVIQDAHGKALLTSGDFWLVFSIMSLLAGTGLMYINNVGSISQALFLSGHTSSPSSPSPPSPPSQSLGYQTLQVSLISIFNCSGRILSGISADILKNTFSLPRSYTLVMVSLLFLLSQLLLALYISNIDHLWQASVMLGVAYGGLFGVLPTITIEWFGLSHFSENWGFVSLSPLVGGNLFSLAFGHNLDAHAPDHSEPGSSSSVASSSPSPSSTPSTSPLTLLARLAPGKGIPPGEQCYAGRQCYVSSVYLTAFACTCALGLSMYAAWKDRRRMTVRPADYEEVIWEEEEEEEEEAGRVQGGLARA